MPRLVEWVHGTSQERGADDTIRLLQGKLKRTPSDERRLKEAKGLSRRLLMKRGLVATAGLTVGATTIANLLGRDSDSIALPLVSENPPFNKEQLQKVINALVSSSFPLLHKVGVDSATLYNSPTKSSEFPDWIDWTEGMKVSVGTEPYSIAAMGVDFDSTKAFQVTIPGKSPQTLQQIRRERIGIHLGLTPHVKAGGPMATGIFFAKEHLTHMLAMRMQLEFYDVGMTLGFTFSTPDGLPITDRQEQIRVGASAYYSLLGDEQNLIARVLDASPVMLMGLGLTHMINKREISKGQDGIGNYRAAQHILDRDFEGSGAVVTATRALVDSWVSADTLLPPAGISAILLSPAMLPALLQLKEEMGYLSEVRTQS